MAQTERRRTIANTGKRRMSAKQKKYFGSKRQRSAARHRSNAGEIVGYTLSRGNPAGRKRGTMATSKKKNKGRPRASKSGYKRRSSSKHASGMRHNTGTKHHHRSRRSRRNVGGESLTNIVTNAVFVIAGALGSKLLTQMVLGANNVGLIGYAGNAIAGGAMWFLTEKVMHNRTAANGVIAGTAVQIILRLINDYTPFGQYVSQLGMGDYQAQAFVTPQVLVDPYNSATIRIPGAWLPAPAPATTVTSASAASGVSGYGGGDLYGGKSNLY
jgi:hypothetical protein